MKGYRPAADVLMLAKQYGDKFTLTNDPDEAARDADVLFTDVWVSMGMEREAERRRRDFTGFTLDAARMALAKPDCMVQHPLPAHRGEAGNRPDVLEGRHGARFCGMTSCREPDYGWKRPCWPFCWRK